jgi:hypothetical protein
LNTIEFQLVNFFLYDTVSPDGRPVGTYSQWSSSPSSTMCRTSSSCRSTNCSQVCWTGLHWFESASRQEGMQASRQVGKQAIM